MLIGRERELEQLDALLREARLGRGRALVLRGSAGIGKTVLLDYAAQQASGFQVLHYTAVDSEAALPMIELGPLEAAASMELLRERFGSAIAAKVARHLAAATGGNPLALLEVAALLDEGERAGSEPLPDYLPASESVERTVRRTL